MEEKAALRPYHWAEYCLRPAAFVKGSAKTASSVQRASFLRDGRPEKSYISGYHCASKAISHLQHVHPAHSQQQPLAPASTSRPAQS